MTDTDHLDMNGILKEIRIGTRMEAAGVESTANPKSSVRVSTYSKFQSCHLNSNISFIIHTFKVLGFLF